MKRRPAGVLEPLEGVIGDVIMKEEDHENERLQPLVGEIAWAHNLAIMSKCKVIV